MNIHQKVTASHLSRKACLYVRQSTMQQVVENTESTERQYALRERAMALGWPTESIEVIDCDLGLSGADRDRRGFKELVSEVGMGRVGIVLGLEVSRLARNSSDWHQLLEICGLTQTLILDEEGIYDPCAFNDRLLMGMKGAMSEAELHMLKLRLHGGLMNKAKRGTLKISLPVGLVYDPMDRVVLDPSPQVQDSINMLFDVFRRTGASTATVRHFRDQGILFPSYPQYGSRKDTLCWLPLGTNRVLKTLHNPRYAGAFVYGRRKHQRNPDGSKSSKKLEPKDWKVLIRDAHPGYISWERYEANRKKLQENSLAHGLANRKFPPREGPALLQGLAICGYCGGRMAINYQSRKKQLYTTYVCQAKAIETGSSICQHVPGRQIDKTIGDLMVELMVPDSLEVALQVQQELARQAEEVDTWRQRRVQSAREEADVARHRYMQANPDNRIVADVLEAEWNAKLRDLDEARQELEHLRNQKGDQFGEQQRQRVLELATDFPRLWNNPATPDRERKRMIRLVVEDVTLTKGDQLFMGIRFRSGATREIMLETEKYAWKKYVTPPGVVAEIDTLLDTHIEMDIATILNDRGLRSGFGGRFNYRKVKRIRRSYGLKSRYERLRGRGLLLARELALKLKISVTKVRELRREGVLVAHPYKGKTFFLYEIPTEHPVKKSSKPHHKIMPATDKNVANRLSRC